MSFCNPSNIDDFYNEKPEYPKKTPEGTTAPTPPHDGALTDPDVPGNVSKEFIAANEFLLKAVTDPLFLPTLALQSAEAMGASILAAIIDSVDPAIVIAQEINDRFRAIEAITHKLDDISLGNFGSLSDESADLLQGLQDLKIAVLGTTLFNAETNQALSTLKNNYLDPMINWTNRVQTMFDQAEPAFGADPASGELALVIDLSDADGSLTNFTEVIAGIFDGMGGLGGPWKAPGQVMSTWIRGGLNMWKGVLDTAQGIDDTLAAAEQFLEAAQTTLLAACEAIPAMYMMLKHLFDSIWALGKFNFNFNLNLPNLTQIHFKLPSIPLFDRLNKWLGAASNLDSKLGATLAKCIGTWQVEKTANGVGTFPAANMSALSDGLGGLTSAKNAIIAGKQGIGKTTGGLAKSGDAAQTAWETTKTLLDIAPNPAHTLPEHLAELSGVTGKTAPSGVDPAKIGDGKSAVDVACLQGTGPDGVTPTLPNPHQQIENRSVVSQELCATLTLSNELGKSCVDVGTAAKVLGAGATEQQGKDALAAVLKASQTAIYTRNMALDKDLKNQSEASKDYYLCRALDIADGTRRPATTNDAMTAEAIKAFEQCAGLPNSIALIAQKNRDGQVISTSDALINVITSALPGTWADTGHMAYLQAYLDPTNFEQPIEDLPFMLLSHNTSDRNLYQQLQLLNSTLQNIRGNAALRKSHADLRTKAISQGLHGNSPYTWLADGLDVLSTFLREDGTEKTLLEVVTNFLTHQPADIRPVIAWLRSITTIDEEVPIPNALNDDVNNLYNEYAAAQASYSYTQEHGSEAYGDLIVGYRMAADNLGGPLAFEYALGVSTLIVMERMKTLLANSNSTPQQLVTLADKAKSFTAQMTHGSEMNAVLDVLSGLS